MRSSQRFGRTDAAAQQQSRWRRDTTVTTHTLLPKNPLQLYGTALAIYQGTGQLTLSNNRKVRCEFAAGQLETGKTLIVCATQYLVFAYQCGLVTASSFEGTTDDGHQLKVDHIVSETNYLPETTAEGTYFALRVGHLRVCRRPHYSRRHLTFLLTNFAGIRSEESFTYSGLSFVARPIDNLALNLKRLEVLRGVLPTVQLEVTTRASLERVKGDVDELCCLLSIALGTTVQWVALTESTASHTWVCKHHYSHITKRYGNLYVIDTQSSDISTFLQRCGDGRSSRAREQVGLTHAVINTYLDAKSEGDFLQVRALKLVVSVEMLKASFLDKSGSDPLIFSSDKLDGLRPKLQAAIKKVLSDTSAADQRDAVYANIRGLNRTPFRRQLQDLCKAVRMPVDNDEIKRFVASRNKLVHEGHFYCERATEQERAELAPLPSLQSEWFWLLHFVDRLFLRAIDYEGMYIDWSIPTSRTPRQLSPAAP